MRGWLFPQIPGKGVQLVASPLLPKNGRYYFSTKNIFFQVAFCQRKNKKGSSKATAVRSPNVSSIPFPLSRSASCRTLSTGDYLRCMNRGIFLRTFLIEAGYVLDCNCNCLNVKCYGLQHFLATTHCSIALGSDFISGIEKVPSVVDQVLR